MVSSVAPVALFTYNRPKHTERTILALARNTLAAKTDLIIFSDGPKAIDDQRSVHETRKVIRKASGFRSVRIIKRSRNLGLAGSVIKGTTEVISKYGSAIVMEDDLVSSPMALAFLNRMLEIFKDEKRVFSLTAYNYAPRILKIPKSYPYDAYFSLRASSQCWATWSDRWAKADWDVKDIDSFLMDKEKVKEYNLGGEDRAFMLKKNKEGLTDSWAVRWDYAHFRNDGLCLYPAVSFINNIGHDGSGVHKGVTRRYENHKLNTKGEYLVPEVMVDPEIMKRFAAIFRQGKLRKVKEMAKGLFRR